MTPIVSDIRILDNLLALNLNVSLWSARRKMSQDDLGGAELPPEDLASLGSKRIADPENLKVFGTLKARAFNYLDRHDGTTGLLSLEPGTAHFNHYQLQPTAHPALLIPKEAI